MAQGGHGIVSVFEDFQGGIAQTLTDGTEYRYNDLRLAAISGNVAQDIVVSAPNGIATFSGAAGATDGVSLYTLPFQPSTQGTISMEVRFKLSVLTTWGAFIGFQETVSVAEPVNPFTLSGTTLTANNGGNTFGLYYDTTATTDDWRTMASLAGVAQTAAIGLNGAALGTLGTRASAVPVVDSWMYCRVEIDADGAGRVFYGDVSTDPGNTGPKIVGALEAGTLSTTALYHPIATLVDPSTNDPLWSVDFFGARAGRSWAY